jgi:hypothetical protein
MRSGLRVVVGIALGSALAVIATAAAAGEGRPAQGQPARFSVAFVVGHVGTVPVAASLFGMSGAQLGVPVEARREALIAVPDPHGRINTPRFGICAEF